MTWNRLLDLLAVEHRRRLVHDDQPGVLGQRPGHADDLLAGRRQRADLGGRPDLGVAEPGEQLARRRGWRRAGGRGRPRDCSWPRKMFSATREAGDEVELLVDRRDAEAHGGLRVAEDDRLAVPADLPSSGWCAPASTLISVDLPAPFWPSRQCTSPARTSRSTPSSARTPGNCLTMPRISSSGDDGCGSGHRPHLRTFAQR